jgi:hypothetical protein
VKVCSVGMGEAVMTLQWSSVLSGVLEITECSDCGVWRSGQHGAVPAGEAMVAGVS